MVYLIHFDRDYKGCCHYLGFCKDGNMEKRLERHRAGNGAKLLRALNIAGINYKVVRIWEDGDQNFERRLKNQKNAKRYCPVCNPETYNKRKIK